MPGKVNPVMPEVMGIVAFRVMANDYAVTLAAHSGQLQLNAYEPLNGLANLYREQGKYEQAEPLYQRALRIREQQLGLEHPETAEIIHDLARSWEVQGNSEEASIWYARALAVREQALGTHHPKTTETRTHLIALLHALGQHEQAVQLEVAQVES